MRLVTSDRLDIVLDRLGDAFARDVITVEEYERRVELAHAASTTAALDELLTDLSWPGASLTTRPPAHVTGPRARHRFMPAIFGGIGKRSAWQPAETNRVLALMGGAQIDLREALLPPGESTTLHVHAIMGGVQIILPPDVHVDCQGMGILGNFDDSLSTSHGTSASSHLVRIRGFAFMGGVGVETRLTGETSRAAAKRRKGARKAARRAERKPFKRP